MALSFASDSSNEFIIEKGEFVLVSDGAQVVQNVKEKLLSYEDDFFLDRTHGLPYYQSMFTKPVNLNLTESLLKAEILSTEGVQQLLSFQTQFNSVTRVLAVTFTFETIYGDVQGVTINV